MRASRELVDVLRDKIDDWNTFRSACGYDANTYRRCAEELTRIVDGVVVIDGNKKQENETPAAEADPLQKG